jgi:hypothetical protein
LPETAGASEHMPKNKNPRKLIGEDFYVLIVTRERF